MRYMSPFYLLIGTILLTGIWFFGFYTRSAPLQCPSNTDIHTIVRGDTCYAIATERGTTVEKLLEVNPGLECKTLGIGKGICVPLPVEEHQKDDSGLP